MIKYGKSTQNAIAAMSRLAEVYDEGTRLSSAEIGKARNLPQTLTAKLLTTLSQHGLVSGAPGPGGGYALARPPAEISLYDIAVVFERPDDSLICPFGPGWCGNNDPCPLHERLLELDLLVNDFLQTTQLDIFSQNGDSPG